MKRFVLRNEIISLWMGWYFYQMPRNLLLAWKNFLLFYLNFFSLPLLLKTLFSHWHRYSWAYPGGFDLGKYFEVFFSNLLSRIIGAVVRMSLIFLGILVEIFLILAGTVIFFLWLILPFLLIFGLFFAFWLLF